MVVFTKNDFLNVDPQDPYDIERHRIVFLRPQGTFWSLNRDSSLLRYEVIGEIAFWPFLSH